MKHYQGVRIFETLAEIVNPVHTCLVIWDVQLGLVGRIFDKETYVERLAAFVKKLRGRVHVAYTLITPLPLRLQSGWNLYAMMRRFGVDDPSKLAGFMAKGSPEREVRCAGAEDSLHVVTTFNWRLPSAVSPQVFPGSAT